MSEKNRYSDEELAMFKALIENKIAAAKIDLEGLVASLSHKDNNGTDDTLHSFNMMEDGAGTLTREEISQLAQRQEKFVKNLESALIRIQNKTYGICRVTGKLIQKERLLAVPHATLSMEAKESQG